MQMVKVCVSDENVIDRRQVFDAHARAAKPLQDEQPARKVRINHNVLAAGLQKKSRVANEGHAQVAILREHRTVYLPQAGLHCGFPH
jgi:hypothetical protein